MKEYICNNCNSNFDISDFSERTNNNCTYCDSDNIEEVSACCGEKIGDDRICPECKENV